MSDHHQPPSGVKGGLTPNRGRHPIGNDEYAGFARRVIAAYSRRIAAGDIEALTDLVALSTRVDEAITTAVRGLRGFGYSWADIATRLGITRQAAQQRWGGQR
jgi:hypothetical protein